MISIMEKKVYMRPLMKVVKIRTTHLLSGSPQIFQEKSSNASYSRESQFNWDDEE